MGVSPIPFIFAQLWFLCAAVRPSIDEEDLGHRASLLLESNEVPAWLECPEEVQEKLRGQLQGLGLLGEGNPCRWAGIWCYNNCTLRSIRSSDATGGLSSVKEMTDLGVLELAGSQITGNVSELAKLKGLCKLDLSHTEVMGDLAELSKLTALTQLRLPHTQVSGNVAELSKLNLFRLDLSQTEVMGDLAELSKLTALEDLRLPHTQVSGNVAELSKLKELRHLDLSRTQVVGDVSVLTNMTKLYDLSLAQSRVHGDFGVISSMPSLEEADLSSTAVSGNLEDLRWGCCKKLRELHLGDAQVRVSPDVSVRRGLLPALRSFNVSGSKLNASVNDLLAFLASTRITSIVAAGCGLTGELPALLAKTPLGTSLQLLDLSGNGLDAVDALLANLRLDVSRNEIPLRVSRDVIKAAAKSGTDLWMMNTELANREEIMANCSNELQLEQMWTPRETGGYSCHDLVRPNIRVTPERFLPKIMCACGPGHFGAGTNCSACPKNTFNDQMDQSKCQACPQGGKAPAGSQALSACKCPYGTPGTFENKTMCRCDRGEALSSDHECRSCGKLHLVCDAPGSLVATAPLEPGHIRLKEPSEEIFECLDRQHCRNSSCAPGRTGLLCASCAQSYRASKKACIECKNVSSERRLSIGLGCATALVIVAATAWTLRRHAPQRSPRSECLLQLIMAQLAALLQLTQLWTVLGALTPDPQATVTANDNAQGDPVLGYLEALQFTSSEVQNFLALQCLYDGITVRSLFALATPLVPLLLLIACGCLEVFSRGLGIRVGLKMLTVLFIGGASGSAQLLGCQRTDGAGTALKEFAFRPLFPHERCEEAIWVDRFGWATAICYGFFIPCFLGFLFAKQNVVMRKVKTVVMHTARNEAKVTVRLQGPKSEESEKDALAQHLKAAAAAYVAVHVKGRATVELQKDATIVTPIEENAAGGSEALGVESLVFGTDLEDAEVLQRHMMVQMLMERRILEEETDRFMLGAKQLFCKYAKCENVWMEVCTKVAAAALVSVVAVDNLWLCVAITLGMALVTGLTQPFAQPQMNVLQSACFACLALAAVGFRHHMALARLALAVPFVLLVLQLRRPDSPEMLALRLQQELEAKIHEGPVEVSAEQFT